MYLFDASWISHDGGGIFSIDIHPSGRRLVTAGQDKRGAGLMVVWPIEFLYEENAEQVEPEKYDYLAKIGSSKIINVVRWAPSDSAVDPIQGCRRLACGGDDSTLHVYESIGAMMHLGVLGARNSSKRTLENYRCIHKLYGHSVDVMHLDWSPDGRYLASCSLDHSIIVWNALNLPEKCVTLNLSNGGHSAGVKGLAWDPIGRFLATQSDDSTVKLWQTDSWECVRTFSEPFNQSVGTTLFSRMDWSPDGSFLICPGAINNTGPTAKIIMRKNWTFERDFVGYKKAVSCVRSNSRCFYRTNLLNQRITVSCFATGSRDTSLSVWLVPSFGRPLMVLQNIFKASILDLAWSDFTLAACSRDGFVKLFKFNEEELGIALSKHEMACLSEHLYGVSSKLYPTEESSLKKRITDEDRFYDYWLQSKKQNDFQISKKLATKQLQKFVSKIQHQKTEMSADNDLEENENFKFKKLEDLSIFQKEALSIFNIPKQKRLLFSKIVNNKVSMVEVLNGSFSDIIPQTTRLRAYDDEGSILWTVFNNKIVSILATNFLWTSIATFDNVIFIYSTATGRSIFSTRVEATIVYMILKEKCLLVLLKNGFLISWNLDKFEIQTKQNIGNLFENNSQQLIGLFLHDLKNTPELELVLNDCTHWILSKNDKEFAKIASLKDYLNEFLSFLRLLLDFCPNSFEKLAFEKLAEQLEHIPGECEKIGEFMTEILSRNDSTSTEGQKLQMRFLIAFCAFKLMKQRGGHQILIEILNRKNAIGEKIISELCCMASNKENNFDINEFLF